MELTKEVIKQMREADSISITRDSKGNGLMKLNFIDTLRGKEVESSLEYLIDTRLSNYGGYGSDSNLVPVNRQAHCHIWLSNIKCRGVFKTALKHLKPGHSITFEFVSRNNSHTLNEAGLYHDQVKLLVRTSKDSYELDEYLLLSQVSRNNSSRVVEEDSQYTRKDINVYSHNLVNPLPEPAETVSE